VTPGGPGIPRGPVTHGARDPWEPGEPYRGPRDLGLGSQIPQGLVILGGPDTPGGLRILRCPDTPRGPWTPVGLGTSVALGTSVGKEPIGAPFGPRYSWGQGTLGANKTSGDQRPFTANPLGL
jgi:hypothetical protein